MKKVKNKQLKKYLMMIAILFLMLVVGTLGLLQSSTSSYAVFGKTITLANGLYNISIPRGWEKNDSVSSNGLMAAQTKDANAYLNLSLDQYEYGPEITLDNFVTGYMNCMALKSDDPALAQMVTIPEYFTVDGMTGYYYEFSTVADGIKIHMFCYVVRLDEGFLTLDVAVREDMTSQYAQTAKNIIRTLKFNAEQSARNAGNGTEAAPPAEQAPAEEVPQEAAPEAAPDAPAEEQQAG